MGATSRRKGARVENEIVRMHADVCHAEKVSRTGYTGHDLEVAGQFHAEVKSRKSGKGFKLLDEWLGENDLLFLRRDRARPIVVMPWATYALVMREHAGEKPDPSVIAPPFPQLSHGAGEKGSDDE